MDISVRIPLPANRWRLLLLFIQGASLSVSPALAQNTKLIVQPGTTLTVANGNLVLNNTDLQSNGPLNASNATVWVTGSNNSSFGGAATPLFKILTLNTSALSTLTLNNTVQVSNALNFQNGLIDLNNHQLQLTGNAVLQSESETSHLKGMTGGFVTASATGVSNPNQLNTGNLGAAITSSANLGNLTVSRLHKPAVNPANSSQHGIQRTFLVQPQNNTALNATLRFYYLNTELGGANANTLSLWKSNDGVTWTLVGADTRNTVSKYVEKTGIADFSYWTLTDALNALPLTLISFKAVCESPNAILQWQTGSESGIDHFEVERSADGSSWVVLGKLAASNNANGFSYSYKDANPQPTAYYRLKITELSGNYSYSPVFKGGCADIALPFSVYPNPSRLQSVAQVSVRERATASLRLLDMEGRVLYSAAWKLEPGINQYVLPAAGLATGTYVVQLLLNNSILQTKLIKQ
ncbi:MAG: T9SS type A sorting domain-containing protein [Bacteroidetes bacterium]|nr:T9SS type A sorting domain-containing protein [Bacteroidota bacterium]